MDQRLLDACLSGDRSRLQQLVAENEPDILDQLTFSSRDTVLHLAVREGQAEIASYLLNVKPELSTRQNSDGESPLVLACKLGHLSVVDRLLSASASPAAVDRLALHAAASAGDQSMPFSVLSVKPFSAIPSLLCDIGKENGEDCVDAHAVLITRHVFADAAKGFC